MRISFLALAIASKKIQNHHETCAKWSRFGAVSETRGLAITALLNTWLVCWIVCQLGSASRRKFMKHFRHDHGESVLTHVKTMAW